MGSYGIIGPLLHCHERSSGIIDPAVGFMSMSGQDVAKMRFQKSKVFFKPILVYFILECRKLFLNTVQTFSFLTLFQGL